MMCLQDRFVDASLEDTMYYVSHTFRAVGRTIPAHVMHQIVCAANRIKPATVMSKWAVVIQEVSMDIVIEVQGAGKYSELSLCRESSSMLSVHFMHLVMAWKFISDLNKGISLLS